MAHCESGKFNYKTKYGISTLLGMSRAPLDMVHELGYNALEFGNYGKPPSSRQVDEQTFFKRDSADPTIRMAVQAKPRFVSNWGLIFL